MGVILSEVEGSRGRSHPPYRPKLSATGPGIFGRMLRAAWDGAIILEILRLRLAQVRARLRSG
jgi:hypothetical protein